MYNKQPELGKESVHRLELVNSDQCITTIPTIESFIELEFKQDFNKYKHGTSSQSMTLEQAQNIVAMMRDFVKANDHKLDDYIEFDPTQSSLSLLK